MSVIMAEVHCEDAKITAYAQQWLDVDLRNWYGQDLFAGQTEFDIAILRAMWETWIKTGLEEYKSILQIKGYIHMRTW